MQLIYRGQAFNFSPATLSLTASKRGVARPLVYRGNTYQYQMAVMQAIRLPKAINWRFAGVAEKPHQSLQPAH